MLGTREEPRRRRDGRAGHSVRAQSPGLDDRGLCRLYNPKDVAASRGAGPRYLLGDDPDAVLSEALATSPGGTP